MDVSRDVILDLLPVYLMGEASPATRALVEDYLQRDPELAERVRANATDVLQRVAVATPAPAPELELRSVARTRRLIAWMRWSFALACTFTSIGLGFYVTTDDRGHIVRGGLLVFNHPLLLGPVLLVGIACWVAYFALRPRLRSARS